MLVRLSRRDKSFDVAIKESAERSTPAPRLMLSCRVFRTVGSSKNSAESFAMGSENSGKSLLISAAIRALKTSPSNNELDARRLAP